MNNSTSSSESYEDCASVNIIKIFSEIFLCSYILVCIFFASRSNYKAYNEIKSFQKVSSSEHFQNSVDFEDNETHGNLVGEGIQNQSLDQVE